jgi:hypothetical protein
VTHDKHLPPIESSKRFLSGYLKLIQNSKEVPTELVIKGKKLMLEVGPSLSCKVKKASEIPWSRPPQGWVKVNY